MFSYYSVASQVPEYHKLFQGDLLLQAFTGGKSLLSEIAMREMDEREHSSIKVTNRRDLLARFFDALEANPEKMTHKDVFSIAHGALYVFNHKSSASKVPIPADLVL